MTTIEEFQANNPHPGKDPVARLRHVNAVFNGTDDEEFAIMATSNAYGSLGKTGLTWGDLKALESTITLTEKTCDAFIQQIKALKSLVKELNADLANESDINTMLRDVLRGARAENAELKEKLEETEETGYAFTAPPAAATQIKMLKGHIKALQEELEKARSNG